MLAWLSENPWCLLGALSFQVSFGDFRFNLHPLTVCEMPVSFLYKPSRLGFPSVAILAHVGFLKCIFSVLPGELRGVANRRTITQF